MYKLSAMNCYLFLIVTLFTGVSAYNFSCKLPEDEDRWYVLVEKYKFDWVTRETAEAEIEELKQTENLVQYYLWTQENPKTPQPLILDDITSLKESNFNSSNPTRIMVHGFRSLHKADVCTEIINAYLRTGPHNGICIDYSKISNQSYPTVRYSVESIGNDLGAFINFLVDAGGMSMNDFVLASHSLGTHIAGFAGKYLKKLNNTLPVIIALDPARQLFNYEDCSGRICHTDADFIESIQTGGGGKFGFYRPIGHSNYYPNGGSLQPGCGADLLGTCSHLRAFYYYAEAIEYNNFPSKNCNTLLDAVSDKCGKLNDSLKMGTMESFGRKGLFYVPINSKPPFGNASLTTFRMHKAN